MANSKYQYRYFTYVEPVLRSPVVKTYGTTIFTIAVLIIFTFFAIKPTVETILVLQKKLENSQKVYEKIIQKSENLTLARQNYQNIDSASKAKIRTLIPVNPDIKTVIQTLEAIALINQASISAIQVQPITINIDDNQDLNNSELAEVTFTLNLEGNYNNLVSFIKQLRRANRLFTIEGMSLNRSQGSQNILLSINGKAYFLK